MALLAHVPAKAADECLLRRFTELVPVAGQFFRELFGCGFGEFWTAATWICECLLRVRSTSGWVMFSFPAMDWTACTRAANSCDSDLA